MQLNSKRQLSRYSLKQRGHTIDEAWALHQKRRADWPTARHTLLGATIHVIPLGGHYLTPTAHTRAKNWDVPYATHLNSWIDVVDHGAYSSRCTFRRKTYQQHVQSWGVVANGHLLYWIDTDEGLRRGHLRPYRGWRFSADRLGIYIADRHGQRIYHITAWGLANLSIAEIVRTAINLDNVLKKRERTLRQAAADQKRLLAEAKRLGVYVCLSDSTSVGHCRAGTETWARQRGLDVSKHHPVAELPDYDRDSRVRLVVAQALRRHRAEMKRGYCSVPSMNGGAK